MAQFSPTAKTGTELSVPAIKVLRSLNILLFIDEGTMISVIVLNSIM